MMPEHRNPLCIPPHGTARGAQVEMIDRQAARLVELDGQLASARGKLHDANNLLTCSLGALQMIAVLLGLDDDATPPQIIDAAQRRLR